MHGEPGRKNLPEAEDLPFTANAHLLKFRHFSPRSDAMRLKNGFLRTKICSFSTSNKSQTSLKRRGRPSPLGFGKNNNQRNIKKAIMKLNRYTTVVHAVEALKKRLHGRVHSGCRNHRMRNLKSGKELSVGGYEDRGIPSLRRRFQTQVICQSYSPLNQMMV